MHHGFITGPLKFAAWSSGLETPKLYQTDDKDKMRFSPSVICELSDNMANANNTHLELCASAGFDVFRGEPLPHFDQSQAFGLIDVKHSLVTRQRQRGRGIIK